MVSPSAISVADGDAPPGMVNTVRWWRQEGTAPEFFKIGRRLYTTVGDLRTFIRLQRLASQPVLGKPKAV